MKKNFRVYFAGWLLALVLFNVVSFAIPGEVDDASKLVSLPFWIGYALITLCFIGQLACTYFVFKSDSARKTFYNIPLFTLSSTALVIMLVVGGICMIITPIIWVGVIACAVVLVINIFAILKSIVAIDVVSDVDKKTKTKTMFVRMITADAEALLARAGDETHALANDVYEAIRYSDPMSDEALAYIESKIADAFRDFAAAVDANNVEAVENISKILIAFVNERNAKCKILK